MAFLKSSYQVGLLLGTAVMIEHYTNHTCIALAAVFALLFIQSGPFPIEITEGNKNDTNN